jgi:ABC-2 type transport system permease protein
VLPEPLPAGAAPVRRRARLSPRRYLPLSRVALASTLSAKGAFLLGTGISALTMVAVIFLWHAVYARRSAVQSVTWKQMESYLVVTFVMSRLVSYSIGRIGRRVLDGSIAVDLTRPVDFQLAQLTDAFGVASVEGTVAFAIAVVAAVSISDFQTPHGALETLLFLVSLALIVPLKFAMVYLANLATFWTQNSIGVTTTLTTLTLALSGTYIPVTLLPHWLELVARALPFQAVAFGPAWIFIGRVGTQGALAIIGVQVAWIVVLGAIGRVLWERAARAVTFHGG